MQSVCFCRALRGPVLNLYVRSHTEGVNGPNMACPYMSVRPSVLRHVSPPKIFDGFEKSLVWGQGVLADCNLCLSVEFSLSAHRWDRSIIS